MTERGPKVEYFRLRDDGSIPNNDRLPLAVFRAAVPAGDPSRVEEMFAENGWTGAWRNGVYDYHHYHSNAHEVLGVFAGSATVCFGGEGGVEVKIAAGDVVIIPAGVGHKSCGASPDFEVVGAYPEGSDNDLCTGRLDERPQVLENIATVPLPAADPVYGRDGPLLELWH